MKVDTKKLENCQFEVAVSLDAGEVAGCVKNVEKIFLRSASLPGFRKGKAPLDVVKRYFAADIKQETFKEIIGKHGGDAVKESKLDVERTVGATKVDYNDNGGEFTLLVEVKPEFKVPTYKGLKIKEADITIKDEEVAEQVERMREAYASYDNAADGADVKMGDFVQIDYNGTVDGKNITEINPEAKAVAEGKGFWMQASEGRFLPEIIKAVVGMKVGETKEKVKAKFDKESAPDGLKGAKAEYTVKVTALRSRRLPDDAELAKKTKSENFEALVAKTRKNMEDNKQAQESTRRENDVCELLLKKSDFDVPQTTVTAVKDEYLQKFAERAQYSGLPAEYFEKNAEKIAKDAEEFAVKQVRMMYIVRAIAEAEKIPLDNDEVGKKVIELILANAKKG